MKIIRKSIVFSIFVSLAFMAMRVSFGCAVIVPPTGGPKDTLPPKLMSAVPKNFLTNFNANKIVLNFDEFVDLDNPIQNIIISPTPKMNPLVDRKLRVVTIKIKDTLIPNTTYIYDFGKTIKDVNEGNVLKNFSYVFSTGSYIDSLTLSGKVILAETGGKDSSLIVILHSRVDDSALVKDRPRYVARLDSAGNFMFHYLSPGTYALYALKDEGGSKKYMSTSQLFAFCDTPVVVSNVRSEPITLYAYAEKEETKKTTAKTTTAKKEKSKDEVKRIIVKTNASSGGLDLLDSFKIQFQTPLKTFDSTKVHFTDGDFKKIKSYKTIVDTALMGLKIITNWLPDSPYHVILEKEFAVDTLGQKLLKSDTISFRTKKESDYGEVRIRFRNIDMNKNPVLLFIENDVIKFSGPLINKEFYRKLFIPGEYQLRILYDTNKNGIWDAGEFFGKHIQPEKVIKVPINNKKHVFTVKGNGWENDLDITL